MMEYKAITADNSWELTERVNAEISKGWQPIGGISIAVIGLHFKTTYAQAVIKPTEKQNK